MRRRPVAGVLVVALTTVLSLTGCSSEHSSGSPAVRAARFYLSLGDSLAFGFTLTRADREMAAGRWSPASFPGYTRAVAAGLGAGRGVPVTNLSCPGETTSTFRTGGCPFRAAGLALHRSYPGAQLAAATAFLAARRGVPGLVTVSLGANDVDGILRTCLRTSLTAALGCLTARLPAAIAAVRRNLAISLAALRRADPAATIEALAPYNPFAAVVPATDPLARALDSAIAAAARAAGARVADAFAVFNRRPGERSRLCRLTAICAADPDVHPTPAGYRVLARLLLADR